MGHFIRIGSRSNPRVLCKLPVHDPVHHLGSLKLCLTSGFPSLWCLFFLLHVSHHSIPSSRDAKDFGAPCPQGAACIRDSALGLTAVRSGAYDGATFRLSFPHLKMRIVGSVDPPGLKMAMSKIRADIHFVYSFP